MKILFSQNDFAPVLAVFCYDVVAFALATLFSCHENCTAGSQSVSNLSVKTIAQWNFDAS